MINLTATLQKRYSNSPCRANIPLELTLIFLEHKLTFVHLRLENELNRY